MINIKQDQFDLYKKTCIHQKHIIILVIFMLSSCIRFNVLIYIIVGFLPDLQVWIRSGKNCILISFSSIKLQQIHPKIN